MLRKMNVLSNFDVVDSFQISYPIEKYSKFSLMNLTFGWECTCEAFMIFKIIKNLFKNTVL